MNALLISTYDLGHQPFGLASVAAWLRQEGASIAMADLAVQPLEEEAVRAARLIAIHLPMHTATRLAIPVIARCRSMNRAAHICCFGLYAPMNESHLREQGADSVIGGEFETAIAALYRELAKIKSTASGNGRGSSTIELPKQAFFEPERRGLPPLSAYSKLVADGTQKPSGYTEASRGCKHLCRHCPVVPVYNGQFRIVQRDIVLADIRQQVAQGAEHITFGDPDFFNGVTHAIRIVQSMHEEFSDVTFDVTIKVEHLLRHSEYLSMLREAGCLFITTAVESIDDRILALLDKGHTRADFLEAVRLTRASGITLSPTFVPFNPWETPDGYLELLRVIDELGLANNVAPIQLAIRLLLPAGSYLMQLEETRRHVTHFDSQALAHQWKHPDPVMDELYIELRKVVAAGEAHNRPRVETFGKIWDRSHDVLGQPSAARSRVNTFSAASSIPHMTEQWYCCAEPTEDQFNRL